jgi:hypothetical protein
LLSVLLAAGSAFGQTQFDEPVALEADGQPIVVERNHAAPFVYDFNGDGVKDLLVGQFLGGKLRIYQNTGTNEAPVFGKFVWFGKGRTGSTIPAG